MSLPTMRSAEIVESMTQAFLDANEARIRRLTAEKAQRKRARKDKKKRKKRRHSSSSSSSGSGSGGSTSSGASIEKILGRDTQPFRKAARIQPGLIFASAIAQARAGIQSLNHELQPSRSGPVFKSWADFCFEPKHGSKLGARREEFEMLNICLDEIVAGRFVECADVLSSRLRYITEGTESGNWESAKEFVVYTRPRQGLTTDNMMQVAHESALRRLKLDKRAAQVNRAAGR